MSRALPLQLSHLHQISGCSQLSRMKHAICRQTCREAATGLEMLSPCNPMISACAIVACSLLCCRQDRHEPRSPACQTCPAHPALLTPLFWHTLMSMCVVISLCRCYRNERGRRDAGFAKPAQPGGARARAADCCGRPGGCAGGEGLGLGFRVKRGRSCASSPTRESGSIENSYWRPCVRRTSGSCCRLSAIWTMRGR